MSQSTHSHVEQSPFKSISRRNLVLRRPRDVPLPHPLDILVMVIRMTEPVTVHRRLALGNGVAAPPISIVPVTMRKTDGAAARCRPPRRVNLARQS